MQNFINRSWSSILFWISLALLFLFSAFPGKGGFEGGQREISTLSLRNDNWGFLTPFYFGGFPDLNGYWRITLVTIQITGLWLGIYLLVRDLDFSRTYRKLLFLIFIVVSSVFGSQLWRDSTLFCYVILGLGLIKLGLTWDKRINFVIITLGIVVLTFGLMFKPIYSVLFVIFIIILIIEKFEAKQIFGMALLIALILPITPYVIDKNLSMKFNLQEVYPEQQPMIYDMAALYCWGNTDKSREEASRALRIVLAPTAKLSSVCSFQILTSWDSLHTNRPEWDISAPVIRIVNDDDKLNHFKNLWFKTILFNFRDYVMAKKPFLAEVLTMANSFVRTEFSGFNAFPSLSKMNSLSWEILYYFAVIFDKLRILTVGFALSFFIGYFYFKALKRKNPIRLHLLGMISEILLFLNLILLSVIGTVAYVANNGRYVLPTILTTWLFFFRSIFKLKSH